MMKKTWVLTCAVAVGILLAVVFWGQEESVSIPVPEFPTAPPEYGLVNPAHIHNTDRWGIMNTHDPALVKDGDTYYIFSTDYMVGGPYPFGIMVRRSQDLIDWEYIGQALDDVPEEVMEWANPENLWAPDVVKMNDTYYLYYTASRFGVNRSYIGLATSDSIEGPWEHQGEVIKTTGSDPVNAIDPNITFDRHGVPWMVYGSFWEGIHLLEIDPDTGKPVEEGFGTQLAVRDFMADRAIEGPNIVYNPELDMYYLFTSYGSLNSDYNVRVGRSDEITGPYVDFNGNELTDLSVRPHYEAGTKLFGGYQLGNEHGWVAPGHNTVLRDGDNYFMAHHARAQADPNWSYLHIRKIVWTEDGWPVVSPSRYAGETLQPIPDLMLVGEWEHLRHERDQVNVDSQTIEILSNGVVASNDGEHNWTFEADNTLVLTWETDQGTQVETVTVLPGWDWRNDQPTLYFTGLDQDGVSVWGKKSEVDLE
ncbi:arabinan endo-1,5-alpha-L-arabinosidase [Evansella vedderi]|uniref:Arabinan endo-1,5-alpha-L-arabinosidase n=1 Tax=Evansella vedderi TaxID=38282 RepID=A0ABU0A195_9BACI|nr:arabinan endo-1,5-alpha-L-arabinosidase [Evansella vedderi]MDQ0256782.1 arabinan endo-1,5-alpha-L-arabinosidase [Evansella vedderi]